MPTGEPHDLQLAGAPHHSFALSASEIVQIALILTGLVAAYLALSYSFPTFGSSQNAGQGSNAHQVFDQ